MPQNLEHLVLSVEHGGLAAELVSAVEIIKPLTKRRLRFEKGIWDTGATSTAIRRDLAASLGLVATGQTRVTTASGTTIEATHVIDLVILHSNVRIDALNVSVGDLGAQTEVLIGMDVIALGDFFVQNDTGKTSFSFCLPPFENKIDAIEKANRVNKRTAKARAKASRGKSSRAKKNASG